MLVALALSSQVFRAVLLAPTVPAVKSWLPPLAVLRHNVFRNVKSAAVSKLWPFLLLQNPSVNPPPAPRQTLPNSRFASGGRVTYTFGFVVCNQFVSIASASAM